MTLYQDKAQYLRNRQAKIEAAGFVATPAEISFAPTMAACFVVAEVYLVDDFFDQVQVTLKHQDSGSVPTVDLYFFPSKYRKDSGGIATNSEDDYEFDFEVPELEEILCVYDVCEDTNALRRGQFVSLTIQQQNDLRDMLAEQVYARECAKAERYIKDESEYDYFAD